MKKLLFALPVLLVSVIALGIVYGNRPWERNITGKSLKQQAYGSVQLTSEERTRREAPRSKLRSI